MPATCALRTSSAIARSKRCPIPRPTPRPARCGSQNLQREASLLATLSHPGIVRIYDYFPQENRVYLVLEYIDGKDLETYLDEAQGPMREADVLNWAIQICQVLSYLHHHKPQPIVFRDMKPSNIMLVGDKVTLVDFGIAKVFQSDKKGTMIGTEGYSPPEQYRGLAEPRGDIYALGATMHHLLTGSDPRTQTPFTFHERPPRLLNPKVSPWMESIVMRALEYEIERRWTSADELLEALQAGQRQLQGEGSAPTPVVTPPPAAASAPVGAAPPVYPQVPPGYPVPPPGYPAVPPGYPAPPYGYPAPAYVYPPPPGTPGAPGAPGAGPVCPSPIPTRCGVSKPRTRSGGRRWWRKALSSSAPTIATCTRSTPRVATSSGKPLPRGASPPAPPCGKIR